MKPEIAYPRIETARLALRALRMEDTDFIFKEWSDPAVTEYLRDEEPLTMREQAAEFLRPYQSPDTTPCTKWWGIELKANPHLIGTCGYFRWSQPHHRAEIGYDLCPSEWGQGLMPEALQGLLRYGFERMGLNRIEAMTHIENQRSQRVLTKLGFQREGRLREYHYQDGLYNDQYQYSLLRREWRA